MKNKIDCYIEELTEELFIIEGEITDLLTRETLQNINEKYRSTTSGIAVGSALLGQIGAASMASFAANDEGIDVSEFAIELRDQDGVMHYFKGCFPEIVFKVGDQVQVIAQPFKKEYAYVNAIIDIEKQYMWTSQQVEKGRINYKLWSIKFFGLIGMFSVTIFIFVSLFTENGMKMITHKYGVLLLVSWMLIMIFIGWRVGASFDEQSSELEAILNKIGFYKPTMMNLGHYSVYDVNHKNKVDQDQSTERWMHYTYRIDLAKKEDKEKYGNNK